MLWPREEAGELYKAPIWVSGCTSPTSAPTEVTPNSAAATSLLMLLDFHSWGGEVINQILIFAFVLKCPWRGNLPFTCFPGGKPSCSFRLSFQTQGCPQLAFFPKKLANNASSSQSIFFQSRKGISKADSSCLLLKKDLSTLWESIFKAFSFQCPVPHCLLPLQCVLCHPWLDSHPSIWIFFCFQGLTLIIRADATLLNYVTSTAPGSCSRHSCPAREARCRSQHATTSEPMLSAAKLRSNTTAVWDRCAAGAYPVGQCLGHWHCMLSWLNSLLCLVTMSFCLLELREDFLLWPWWTLVKLRCDDQKNVFSWCLCYKKQYCGASFVAYLCPVPLDLSWSGL